MIDKIRAYLDHAFKDVPDTKKSRDLKDELFANLVEKYSDQLSDGKSEDHAFQAAIAGIGDIAELIDELRSMETVGSAGHEAAQLQEERRKKARLIAGGVACIVACPIPIFLFNAIDLETIGISLMTAMVAVGVGLMIYANLTGPKYVRMDDSVVEDFKEWRAHNQNKTAAYRSFHSAFWAFTVAIYLFVSFVTFKWHVTWIIFIIAVAVSRIINGWMHLNGMNEAKEENHD